MMIRTQNTAPMMLLGLLVTVVAVVGAVHLARTLLHPYPVEYGEGVVLYWSERAATDQELYPYMEDGLGTLSVWTPWIHNPYPPLYTWIAGLFYRREPPLHPFFWIRFLSLLGTCLCATLIALRTRRENRAWLLPLFVLSPVVLRYAGMGRVDLFGLAFALGAITMLDRHDTGRCASWAGVLCACAVMVKLTYVMAAVAGLCFCFGRGIRRGALFTAGLAVGTVVLGGVARAMNGYGPLVHLFDLNQLPVNVPHALRLLGGVAGRHPVLLAGLALYLVRAARARTAAWWYGLAALFCLFFTLKTGAEEQYTLELVAAATLACILLLDTLELKSSPALAWCLAAQLLLYLPIRPAPVFTRTYGEELSGAGHSVTPTHEDRVMGDLLVAELRSVRGDVLCEDLGYLQLAGKRIILQPYQFCQLARAGRWDDRDAAQWIAGRCFDLIVISTDPATERSEYFTNRMCDAMNDHYRLRRIIGKYRVLEPDTAGSTRRTGRE